MIENIKRAAEKVLPDILEDVKDSREANKNVPISGERYTLPLEGRDIDIAYYRAKSKHAPLMIGLHGGGFLFGGSALDDDLWVNVSDVLDVNVASVDYRMSPNVKDYDCLYDVYDSTVYMISHADEFGFDPEHVSVFGCSAGGNLSAAAALLSVQRGEPKLDNQILMYPFLDGASDPDSKGDGSFTGLLPHLMNYLHFSPGRENDPLLSPYYAPREMLENLPNAIAVYCENDNLREEAVEYCENLRDAGVTVHEMLAEGMPHGFIECGFKEDLNKVEKKMLGENGDELISSGQLRESCFKALEFVKENMIR